MQRLVWLLDGAMGLPPVNLGLVFALTAHTPVVCSGRELLYLGSELDYGRLQDRTHTD